MAEFTTMIERDYDISKKLITVRNPQEANSMVKHVHLTVGNVTHTFDTLRTETAQNQIPGAL